MSDTYLSTTFKDREKVKALGARWDPDRRRWFVPAGRDLRAFAAWLPASSASAVAVVLSAPVAMYETAPGTGMAIRQTGIALSELMAGVAQAVAHAYRNGVWTRVEVVKVDARRGHVYLELTERTAAGDCLAQARAVIWVDTASRIVADFERATGVVLGGGIKLLVRARPGVHPVYGLSLVIDAIDPDYTLGDLEAKKREIRARLQGEGLFEQNRRLPQPWDYRAVVVVAPPNAAGLGDFQAEARRLERFGVCSFAYVHSRFQGDGAAAEIRQALDEALGEGLGRWSDSGGDWPDAVVILRGGGAVNDLGWLNDYALARWVCQAPVPVLTGIGHERDSTVLDEVANTSFDTPSKVIAGIEQVIARRTAEARAHFEHVTRVAGLNVQTVRRAIDDAQATVVGGATRHLSMARERTAALLGDVRIASLQQVRRGAEGARDRVQEVRQRALSQLSAARTAVPAMLQAVRSAAHETVRTARHESGERMAAIVERSGRDTGRARDATRRGLQEVADHARRIAGEASSRSEALVREVAGQGPDKALARGFAIVRSADGATLTSAKRSRPGEAIDIQFRDGRMAARTAAGKEDEQP